MHLKHFKCRNANTFDSLVLRLTLLFVIVVRGDRSDGGRLSSACHSVEPKQKKAPFVLPIKPRRYSPGCTDTCVGKAFGVEIILGVVEGDYQQPLANPFFAEVFLHKFNHGRLVLFHAR